MESLKRIFDALFDKENALLKDIRFSDLWAAKLEVPQQRILDERGFLGADVRGVIRTFCFAPQRFQSFYSKASPGPLESLAASPANQSGHRKPKHSTTSLILRSRVTDWKA